MKTLKYYLFCIIWLWKNREWKPTRQKFKALENAWFACEAKQINTEKKSCYRCKHFVRYSAISGICKSQWKYKEACDLCDCRAFTEV